MKHLKCSLVVLKIHFSLMVVKKYLIKWGKFHWIWRILFMILSVLLSGNIIILKTCKVLTFRGLSFPLIILLKSYPCLHKCVKYYVVMLWSVLLLFLASFGALGRLPVVSCYSLLLCNRRRLGSMSISNCWILNIIN